MSLAEVNTTVIDGALGLSPQDLTALSAAVGVSTSGTANAITLYSKAGDAQSELGTGPLVEKLAYHIVRSKKPVYGMRLTSSVAGTAGSITKSNVSGPTIVQSGAPRDSYSIELEIMQDGVITSGTGTGAFKYTVDGGDAYTPEIAIPVASANAAAVHTGTVDTTTSGLYGGGGTLNGTEFDYTPLPGGSPVTVTLTAPANAAAVVTQINTQLSATIASIVGDRLRLTSAAVGDTGGFTLAAGSPDALVLLGLTAGTYNGTTGTGTYVLGDTGIALTWPQGTYTAGETYTWTTTEPNYSLSNLSDGLDVFLADAQKQWFVMHVVGSPSTASGCRAMADLLATYADDAEALHRFTRFMMETRSSIAKADLKAQFLSFEHPRVLVSFGNLELTSEATRDLQKRVFSRPTAWPFLARLAAVQISEKAAYVGRGKMAGVVSVDQTTLDAAEEMADARFVAVREVIGANGYYIAEDAVMAPSGSDFSIMPYCRIMDTACTTVRRILLRYLQGRILVDPATGFILESQAQAIEDDVNAALRSALVNPQHATSAVAVVTRDENIISAQAFTIETRVVPPGYAKTITHTIGFNNPTVTEA